MQSNRLVINEARWCQLPAALRRNLRRVFKRKSVIVGQKVLTIAVALCERNRPDVALALYDTLAGQPGAIYGCGFGAMWALNQYMGERGPDPTGTIWV
jgi:hypothetical protein